MTMGELRAFVKDRMAEESIIVLGSALEPIFYTPSTDRAIWELSLDSF